MEIRHRKGEIDRKGRTSTDALIQACASDRDFSDMEGQFTDMEHFVASNEEALRKFCRQENIERCVFDFGICYDSNHPIFSRMVPSGAIAAAGVCNASIELTFYDDQFFESGDVEVADEVDL